eukprot:jgi/Orpsp1_1/1175057/evm.model.c7180000052477.1
MNLDDKIEGNIDFKSNTSYEIWNLLKKLFMKNNEEMKLDLNKKLIEMKYNVNNDFGMFLSNMENTLNKLEELGKIKIICRKCGKRGHISRDCWRRRKQNNYKNNGYRERKSEHKNVANDKGDKRKYQANNANVNKEKQEKTEVERFNEIVENELNTDYNEDDVMIHQKENLINKCDYHINIHFGNGDVVKSELIGQYLGLINNHKIILNDV